MAASEEIERATERACAAVGHLILISSSLDEQLNRICILLLALKETPMLEPAIASIDSSRKVEILKEYSKKMSAKDWKKEVKRHAERVESINRTRNIAAHSVLSFDKDGKAVFRSTGLAKMFKALDLETKSIDRPDLGQFERAAESGLAALASGKDLIENLKRVALERSRRAQARPVGKIG
jgi:hypothetical protein